MTAGTAGAGTVTGFGATNCGTVGCCVVYGAGALGSNDGAVCVGALGVEPAGADGTKLPDDPDDPDEPEAPELLLPEDSDDPLPGDPQHPPYKSLPCLHSPFLIFRPRSIILRSKSRSFDLFQFLYSQKRHFRQF